MVRPREPAPEGAALDQGGKRTRRHSGLVAQAFELRGLDLHAQRLEDLGGNIRLQIQDVVDLPIVPCAPHMESGRGVDQLGGDEDALVGRTGAALDHVAHAELPGDLVDVGRLALVRERRIPGDHEEVTELREPGGHVFGDPVRQVLPGGVRTQVLERQHDHGGPVRERWIAARITQAREIHVDAQGRGPREPPGGGEEQENGSRRHGERAPEPSP